MFNCEKTLDENSRACSFRYLYSASKPSEGKEKSKVPKWLFEPEMEGIVHEIFKKKKNCFPKRVIQKLSVA